MKKAKFTRAVALLLAVLITAGTFVTGVSATSEYTDASKETSEVKTTVYTSTSYASYLSSQVTLLRPKHSTASDAEIIAQNKPAPGAKISVDITDFTPDVADTRDGVYVNGVNMTNPEKTLRNYEGIVDGLGAVDTVYVPESGALTWTVDVPASGFYGLVIEYYPLSIDGKISSAEKKLLVDGQLPFSECTSLTFEKNWVYSYVYTEDEDGDYVFVADNNGLYTVTVGAATVIGTYLRAEVAAAQGKTSADGKTYNRGYIRDINGNDIRSDCEQSPNWLTYTLRDVNGFYSDDLQIYYTAGKHTISLVGSREGILIKSISLFATESVRSYAEYANSVAGREDHADEGKIILMEAEHPDMVSDSSVYSNNDRSSAITSPNDPSAQLLNVIGKESFSTVGQWATYSFSVTKSGYYGIAVRFKQTTLEGMFASRGIKLASSDGEFGLADGTPTSPFAEASLIRFNYSGKWQTDYLGFYKTTVADDGTVSSDFTQFRFYFKEGVTYTLRLEVSLGDMAEIINIVQDSLNVINSCYLNIIKLTGSAPDEYRSYNFYRVMPNTIRNLVRQATVLGDVVTRMKESCGVTGTNTATLTTIALLLDRMASDEDEIAPNLSELKSYIGNLGTWLNDAKKQLVTVDYIQVQPADAKLPKAEAGAFRSIWFEIRAFFSSFFTDYNSMGIRENTEKKATIDVWLAYGRDQSQIWRNLIDDEFTNQTGIAVTLKLVVTGTLLPSVLCGQGPDIYIGLGSTDTINYSIRSAVTPLSQFEDLPEFVVGPDPSHPRFAASALVPLQLYGVTYGIPETSSFNMMFIRDDVLEGLGVDVPETWDDILAAIPIFQANNMMVGCAYATIFNIFLYQRGAGLWLYNGTDGYEYDDVYAGAQIGLGTNTALDAFADMCRLYTDYSFPVTFDAANRFRTGEMPVVIADYVTTYNTLTVFATEIAGMWSFMKVPGTENLVYDENGDPVYDVDGVQKTYIDHTSMTSVTSTIMMYSQDRTQEETECAWEFMKWQCGDTAQAEYGNKMVALIGPSAKYASANTYAIENLSWTAAELANIQSQFDELAAIENYPGAYYIARNVQFAFYNAYNDGYDPADALQGYINTINKEISRKRSEFDLDILEIGQTPEEARAAR